MGTSSMKEKIMINDKVNEDIGTKPKTKPYSFGLKRRRIFDISKERGEVFTHIGKIYKCDGFLPGGNPKWQGIFATEID